MNTHFVLLGEQRHCFRLSGDLQIIENIPLSCVQLFAENRTVLASGMVSAHSSDYNAQSMFRYFHRNNSDTGRYAVYDAYAGRKTFVSNSAQHRAKRDDALGIVIRAPRIPENKEKPLVSSVLDLLNMYDDVPVEAEDPKQPARLWFCRQGLIMVPSSASGRYPI